MMYGADVRQLRELASVLSQAAERVARASSQISARVDSMPWKGGDSERFRSSWRYSARPRLNEVAEALRSAGTTVLRNAEEQDRASGALAPAFGTSTSRGGMAEVHLGTGTWGGVGVNPLIPFINANGDVYGGLSSAYDVFKYGFDDIFVAINAMVGDGGTLLSRVKGLPMIDFAFSAFDELTDTGWEDFKAHLAETGWSPVTIKTGAYEFMDSASNYAAMAALFLPPVAVVALSAEAAKLGMWLGDVTYAGLEDKFREVSITGDISREVDELSDLHDAALKAGDYTEAGRLSGMMSELAEKARRESSGAKGLLNAVVTTGEGLVSTAVDGAKRVGSWLNPFD